MPEKYDLPHAPLEIGDDTLQRILSSLEDNIAPEVNCGVTEENEALDKLRSDSQ